MRRSICLCEPQIALAGEVGNWKFVYTTSTALPKGARLKFDLQSKGRLTDWQTAQTDWKKGGNAIWGYVDEAKPLTARAIEVADCTIPQYEFTLPAELKVGQSFTIILGAPPKSSASQIAKLGSRSQTIVQRRKQFLLYIDPKGNGKYEDPEIFSLDIRGNKLHNIRILAPSFALKNKRFDIIVRFEDQWGNLTNNAPEGTLVELSHEHLRENLSWKLFVPETGFVTLPNLYFNEEGVYHIQLKNPKTKDSFISPPIKCFNENTQQLYWGLLHGESDRVDSSENIESYLRHLRDERALNFAATSAFDSLEETPNEIWKLLSQYVAEFNEEERFITFLGFQWEGECPMEGLRQFIYTKDNRPLLRHKDAKSNNLKKIYKTITPKDAMAIPTFTASKIAAYNYDDFTPEYERVVEIYNAWGSSECLQSEGNPRPIRTTGKKGAPMFQEGTIQRALERNCRFGFIAGGLDDRGIFGEFYDTDQEQYSPGLTAILAPHQTRESLLEALFKRSCYATTGQRIVLGLFLAGNPMGSELDTKTKPGLSVNRHLSGYVAGTAPLKKVEIVRNGKVIKTFQSDEPALDFVFDENEDLKKVTLPGGSERSPFLYYYLRVTQEDGEMAWSSPIWLDFNGDLLLSTATPSTAKKPRKKTK